MAGFVLTNQMAGTPQALAATYKTLTRAVTASSGPRRQRYIEMEFSAISVPNATDCQIQVDLTFCSATAAGTGTAATPFTMDNGAAIGTAIDTAVSTGVVNYTGEPTTYTQAQNWYNRGFNQRSGVLWQASPGHEIVVPSTVSVGPGMRALSSNYTGTAIAKAIFDEL